MANLSQNSGNVFRDIVSKLRYHGAKAGNRLFSDPIQYIEEVHSHEPPEHQGRVFYESLMMHLKLPDALRSKGKIFLVTAASCQTAKISRERFNKGALLSDITVRLQKTNDISKPVDWKKTNDVYEMVRTYCLSKINGKVEADQQIDLKLREEIKRTEIRKGLKTNKEFAFYLVYHLGETEFRSLKPLDMKAHGWYWKGIETAINDIKKYFFKVVPPSKKILQKIIPLLNDEGLKKLQMISPKSRSPLRRPYFD
jgi:hypothetical protein